MNSLIDTFASLSTVVLSVMLSWDGINATGEPCLMQQIFSGQNSPGHILGLAKKKLASLPALTPSQIPVQCFHTQSYYVQAMSAVSTNATVTVQTA